jgi:hypothetical protein
MSGLKEEMKEEM